MNISPSLSDDRDENICSLEKKLEKFHTNSLLLCLMEFI